MMSGDGSIRESIALKMAAALGGRRLFALSDPHLSLGGDKPMHVFGSQWDNHVERLREGWLSAVGVDDIVLVPGDISWGMRLEDARPDLEFLAGLPGEKVFLRGNHDYWWQSLGKMRGLGLERVHFLQNNHVVIGGMAVGGSRLWDFPGIWWGYVSNRDNDEVAEEKREVGGKRGRGEDVEKIRERELQRLALSLGQLPKEAELRVAMTHFPPLGEDGEATEITKLIGSFGIDVCVFGHVHALIDRPHAGADVVIDGTRYVLASSDYLGHTPILL